MEISSTPFSSPSDEPVKMDIAFGGMFYAIIQTDSVDEIPELLPENGKFIASLGCQILVSRVNNYCFPIERDIKKKYLL